MPFDGICSFTHIENLKLLSSKRFCPYGLLTSVAASMDINDSDVMFEMEEKRGRANSIGFKRFRLDQSLATEDMEAETEASKQVTGTEDGPP